MCFFNTICIDELTLHSDLWLDLSCFSIEHKILRKMCPRC